MSLFSWRRLSISAAQKGVILSIASRSSFRPFTLSDTKSATCCASAKCYYTCTMSSKKLTPPIFVKIGKLSSFHHYKLNGTFSFRRRCLVFVIFQLWRYTCIEFSMGEAIWKCALNECHNRVRPRDCALIKIANLLMDFFTIGKPRNGVRN